MSAQGGYMQQEPSTAAERPRFGGAFSHAVASSETARTADEFEYPSQIINDFLFLGDGDNASSHKQLAELGITHILNVTTKERLGVRADEGFVKLFLYIDDAEGENISALFTSACQFLAEAKSAGSRVLVHCMAGRSRSASLVIAYLMRSQAMTLADAFRLVKAKRRIVMPNIGFWQHLEAEELRLFGQASPTPDEYMNAMAIRRQNHLVTPTLLFKNYTTAYLLPDTLAANRQENKQQILNQWPMGWPGASSVEEVLTNSLEHLHDDARLAAIEFLAALLERECFVQQEVRAAFDSFRSMDVDEMRPDIPKIEDYMRLIFAEAVHVFGQHGLILRPWG